MIPYFLRGKQGSHESYIRPVADIFKLEGAIANLNASCWQQALSLTDVYKYMPQKRRNEWNDQIREIKTPRSCLEPGTGHGAIADLLTQGKTTCVEITAELQGAGKQRASGS